MAQSARTIPRTLRCLLRISEAYCERSLVVIGRRELSDHRPYRTDVAFGFFRERQEQLFLNFLMVEQAGDRIVIVFGAQFGVRARLALTDREHEDEDQLQYVRARE